MSGFVNNVRTLVGFFRTTDFNTDEKLRAHFDGNLSHCHHMLGTNLHALWAASAAEKRDNNKASSMQLQGRFVTAEEVRRKKEARQKERK